jgi:hypothetical protein
MPWNAIKRARELLHRGLVPGNSPSHTSPTAPSRPYTSRKVAPRGRLQCWVRLRCVGRNLGPPSTASRAATSSGEAY